MHFLRAPCTQRDAVLTKMVLLSLSYFAAVLPMQLLLDSPLFHRSVVDLVCHAV